MDSRWSRIEQCRAEQLSGAMRRWAVQKCEYQIKHSTPSTTPSRAGTISRRKRITRWSVDERSGKWMREAGGWWRWVGGEESEHRDAVVGGGAGRH